MNKLQHYLAIVLLFTILMPAMSGCHEAKDEKQEPELPVDEEINLSYTNRPFPENVLTLRYCGHPLGDKDVTFKTRNFKTGTIVMENVIPGEKTTAFTVEIAEREEGSEIYDLTVANGRFVTESGIEIVPGAMSVTRRHLSIDLDEVTFLPNQLSYNDMQTGWWGLASESVHLYWKIKEGTYTLSSGEKLVITSENSVNPGILGELAPMLGDLVIPGVLRDIHFDLRGRISAHYSPLNIGGDPAWTLSPANNLCHYYISGDRVMLKPNIAQIIEQINADKTRASSEVNITDMLQEILQSLDEETVVEILSVLSQWITDGIPLRITDNADGSLRLSLTEQEIGALLRLVGSILPQLESTIAGLIPSDLGDGMSEMIGELLESVAVFAGATEKFEFGLNIVPVADPDAQQEEE